jgi:acyl-CoA synthetase (AMP-forming)/AMP-acid ligase II
MLGYLNAPSPFTEDGWFRTGDAVEVGEEYIRILGRQSEIINVGGQKVYPAEVEGVLQLMPGVSEAIVGAESNPITGQIVKAQVRLMTHENIGEFRKRMRQFCKDKLTPYQVPQKVAFVDETMYSGRFKKMRL